MNNTQKTTSKRNGSSASTIKTPDTKLSASKTTRSTITTASQTGSSTRQPSHEEIATRAYQIYLERGGVHGNDQEDWLRAERELSVKK